MQNDRLGHGRQGMESGAHSQGATPGTWSLDPAIARVIEARGQWPYLDLDALPIAEALPLVRFPVSAVQPPNTEDRRIDAGLGRELRVRLYFPERKRQHLPILMHLHGGGFVTGSV